MNFKNSYHKYCNVIDSHEQIYILSSAIYGDAVALMGGSRDYFAPLLDDSRV